MGTRSSDFNYKVALASGLKSLHAGRLRQAEEQFRYLLTRFPDADGGYRGLAKVLIEEEDRPAALRMLLDGGAAVAKSGQRAGAIGLYRDAAALDPHDLTAHRRLAAALVLAGDKNGAADEYVRYIQSALLSGAEERARAEAEFALARTKSHELVKIARSLGIEVEDLPPEPQAAPVATTTAKAAQATTAKSPPAVTEKPDARDRAELMRSAFGAAQPRHDAPLPSQPSRRDVAQPRDPTPPAPLPSAPAREPVAQSERAAETEPAAQVEPVAQRAASSDPWASESELVSDPQAITLGGSDGEQPMPDADQAVEAAAATYLAKGDPRGGEAALEAARRYIADGRHDAASDLLLQLIASGVTHHDAQRLLVDVVRTLGKRDVAKAKCQLLVQALRLDGRDDLAAEVEQLALAD